MVRPVPRSGRLLEYVGNGISRRMTAQRQNPAYRLSDKVFSLSKYSGIVVKILQNENRQKASTVPITRQGKPMLHALALN